MRFSPDSRAIDRGGLGCCDQGSRVGSLRRPTIPCFKSVVPWFVGSSEAEDLFQLSNPLPDRLKHVADVLWDALAVVDGLRLEWLLVHVAGQLRLGSRFEIFALAPRTEFRREHSRFRIDHAHHHPVGDGEIGAWAF